MSFDVPLEQYRERLAPLAVAILSGKPQSEIARSRAELLADVWDAPLERALQEGLDRMKASLVLADADGRLPLPHRQLAHAIVDRVMFELLECHDRNISALEELEAELAVLPPDERPARAAVAARGAGVAARIPRNEIRAAIVRGSRSAAARGLQHPDTAEEGARHIARLLATDARRELARDWVARAAVVHARALPLLGDELRRLAAHPPVHDPGSDPIWIQACLGIVLAESIDAAGRC